MSYTVWIKLILNQMITSIMAVSIERLCEADFESYDQYTRDIIERQGSYGALFSKLGIRPTG